MAAARWLDARLDDTPAELADAVRRLVVGGAGAATPAQMAECALAAFERVARGPQTRACALELLAADALLTYAFEAAADPEAGGSADSALALALAVGPAGDLGRLAAHGT